MQIMLEVEVTLNADGINSHDIEAAKEAIIEELRSNLEGESYSAYIEDDYDDGEGIEFEASIDNVYEQPKPEPKFQSAVPRGGHSNLRLAQHFASTALARLCDSAVNFNLEDLDEAGVELDLAREFVKAYIHGRD